LRPPVLPETDSLLPRWLACAPRTAAHAWQAGAVLR